MGVRSKTRKKLIVFLGLTLLFSSFSYVWTFKTGSVRDVGFFWMWSPGTAAILTQLIYKDSLGDFGWKIGKPRYVLWGYVIVVIYSSVIYGIVWLTGLGKFSPISASRIVLFLTVGLVTACLAALGEEIGWRGFLVPELVKITSARKAALISGAVWVLWHLPPFFFGDYNSSTPTWFQLTNFSITVMGMAILTAWLRIKSGSLWPAVIWHGAENLFVQQIFLSMTVDTGVTEYFVFDFGIGLTVAFVIIGVVYWRLLKE